jgi:hypothetical protein
LTKFLFLEDLLETASSAVNSGLVSESVLENDQLIFHDVVLEDGTNIIFSDVDGLLVTVECHG